MKKVFCFVLILYCTAFTANGQSENEKRQDIKKMIELSGGLKLGAQFGKAMVAQMVHVLRQAGTPLPDTTLAILEEEVGKIIDEGMRTEGGLADDFCDIYASHFNHEEIKGLLAFYKTNLGKKLIEKMPVIMAEAMTVGQQWGEAMGPKLIKELRKRLKTKGIEFPEV